MPDQEFIDKCMTRVLRGEIITQLEAEQLLGTNDVISLAECANVITTRFCGDVVDVETLINAKSGRCPEDCSFCAQSSFYDTGISKYRLLPRVVIVEQARKAREAGATSFCIVCAYREAPENDFLEICEIIRMIERSVGIDVNASLGFLTRARARTLKRAGVKRYNHNLETAKSYFSQICKTHNFDDRITTAKIVKEEGLELCSGGIIGMGETQQQRIELAFSLKSLNPDEVPVNILIGREGTPLYDYSRIDPIDAIKTIAVWRFILPNVILKIAGGRELHLKDKERLALKAGANGIISGGYLTIGGSTPDKDITMIKEIGLTTHH